MSTEIWEKRSFRATAKMWLQPKVLSLLFLGFSAGIPILLIFSTLSVWLSEAGVVKSAITFFSWAALGYSFKFLWAPLVDLIPLPLMTRLLGRRRAWLLLSQVSIISAILLMASVNPGAGTNYLTIMALSAVLLGFSSATQDIVIDAYRIECAQESLQALLASTYIVGYRFGMIVAGAGSLFLADWFGRNTGVYDYLAWKYTYCVMAGVMGVGVLTTFVITEPEHNDGLLIKSYDYQASDYFRLVMVFVLSASTFALTFFYTGQLFDPLKAFLAEYLLFKGGIGEFAGELFRFILAVLAGAITASFAVTIGLVNREMVQRSYVDPVIDFFGRYGGKAAFLLLMVVGFYRVSDIVLGVISNVFYVDLGFSKTTIGGITKSFGLIMTLIGGVFGGVLTVRYGVYRILMLGAILSSVTNLLFMGLAHLGPDITLLSLVVAVDNFAAGIATTAFVAFLSSLTSISFTAVQYAIFSSLMTLCPKLLGGYSGAMVAGVGYQQFFLITALMGIPVILLVYLIRNEITAHKETPS